MARPDIDRLLWMVTREAWSDGPLASREPLHAMRGETVACGYEGDLVRLDRLWVDWSAVISIDGPEPCRTCLRTVPIPVGGRDDAWVELYAARSGRKDNAVRGRVVELEPPAGACFEWEYRLDVGRAQFDDGIGDFFAIRRRRVAFERVRTKPRRLP